MGNGHTSLGTLQATWDRLGTTDPLWAILSTPAARGGNWDAAAFWQTGVDEIGALMHLLEFHELPAARGRALDFGCGVGRLSQALAAHFDEVIGVDVAPSMVEQARGYDRTGGRATYVLNESADLARFPEASFDTVYSRLVLQHMEPRYAIRYVLEFLRVLRPGGALVFQVPSHPTPVSPLGAGAFRAALTALAVPPLVAGCEAVIPVTVRNLGDEPWPATQEIKLANHWRAPDGTLLVRDDGRARLLAELAPSAAVELALAVRCPEHAGSYVLELDMVQDGVAWFADRGSQTTSLPVDVAAAPARPAPPPDRGASADGPATLVPVIEMHAVRHEFVRELVRYGGGVLVDASEDGSAGPGWVSMRYVVTRH